MIQVALPLVIRTLALAGVLAGLGCGGSRETPRPNPAMPQASPSQAGTHPAASASSPPPVDPFTLGPAAPQVPDLPGISLPVVEPANATLAPGVLTACGSVVAWGWNDYGQCTIPPGLTGVTAIAAGAYHTVALKRDGTVAAWGNNDYGQCTIPPGLTGVIAVAAGEAHTVALKSDGTVVAWGWNGYGQCTVPPGLTGVIAVAAGEAHTVALKSDGTVVAWGNNDYGQCTIPPGLMGVTAIAAGWLHTVAVKSDGTVAAWGWNAYGQCNVPPGLTGVSAVAAGAAHTVALKSDGTVAAWGYNLFGVSTVPPGLTGVTAIAAGYLHTVALKNDGTVVAWGYNAYGPCDVPPGLTRVTAIAAGLLHTVAARSAFDLNFLDDYGRSKLNLNSTTGDFLWTILSGPSAGTSYTGTALVKTSSLGSFSMMRATHKMGDPFKLNLSFNQTLKTASGYYIIPNSITSYLADKLTADDPPGCF